MGLHHAQHCDLSSKVKEGSVQKHGMSVCHAQCSGSLPRMIERMGASLMPRLDIQECSDDL